MLKINLLPENERKATLSPIEQFHRTPLMGIIVGAMVLLLISFLMPIFFQRQQLLQLNQKIQVLEPKKLQVDQLQRYLQQLRTQEAAFRGLGKGQNLSAIAQGGTEMVTVGRLVQDLKADQYFALAVKDIQIESIKRVQEKEVEVVQFTLTCALVPSP
jgi:hypothetical protein